LNIPFAWFCFIFPLLGVILTPVLASIHPRLRDYGAVFFSFLAAFSSATLIPYLFDYSSLPIESIVGWLTFPVKVSLGVLVDPLSIVVANAVAWISFVIMVYCLGYMKGDPSISRFWMMMNLFIGSMLLLVLANNLLFVFLGWKMVGLCSYGLIGYYYRDEKKYWIGGPPPTRYITPSHAGLKALIVTGVGDLLMLGGILIVFFYSRTLNLLELYQTCPLWMPEMARSPGTIFLVSFLLLAGPMGKSAQFPFHEWLPEAMAGPAPVSALIHAATMVKSGVYLVARFIPIFYYGQWVAGISEASTFFHLTAWVGAFTAFLAATQGMVALELKKALAYSTVSQIGYMMLGLGVSGLTPNVLVGGYTSGLFHLLSHALFKAGLFLGAGAVIHTAQSIYMQDMGALKKYMPFTWLFMLIAALSLMGLPPLPGFWSKDAILVLCVEAQHYPLFIFALGTVAITSFYTTRLMGMVFHGPESGNIGNLKQKGEHLGEGFLPMTLTCGVLAIGIILLGMIGPQVENFIREGFAYNLGQKLHLPMGQPAGAGPYKMVPFLSVACVLIGAVPAYLLYIAKKRNPESTLRKYVLLRVAHKFLWERWYIDHFYYWFFAGGLIKLSRRVPELVEDPLDRSFHRKLPALITRKANHWLRYLRTESREAVVRIAYVLIFLVLCILALFWRTN
jgi:NADH-quinone oxidoreductase subunit L